MVLAVAPQHMTHHNDSSLCPTPFLFRPSERIAAADDVPVLTIPEAAAKAARVFHVVGEKHFDPIHECA